MKRRTALLVAVGATCALAVTHPVASATDEQVVRGHVTAATGPSTVAAIRIDACPLVSATTEWAARSGDAFATRFDVEPATVGSRFELLPESLAELAITFRGHETTTVTGSFAGVSGNVPAGASTATVCLVAGGPTSFVYRAPRVSRP